MADPNFLSRSYRIHCENLLATADTLEKRNQAYFSSFPASVSNGLFSQAPTDKKEIATAYYEHAVALGQLVERIESDTLAISQLMIQADLAIDEKTVALCDVFLTQYIQFRQSINSYLTESEKLLRKSAEELSLSELLRCLRSLQAKTHVWIEFLTRELQTLPKENESENIASLL